MGVIFTATKAKAPEIEEGLFEADFDGVEEGPELQFGPTLRWNFTAYVQGDPTPINGLTTRSSSTRSKAYTWLSAILGRQPEVDENIDIDTLKGRRCRVMIEDNKNEWPTVTDVKPAKAKA